MGRVFVVQDAKFDTCHTTPQRQKLNSLPILLKKALLLCTSEQDLYFRRDMSLHGPYPLPMKVKYSLIVVFLSDPKNGLAILVLSALPPTESITPECILVEARIGEEGDASIGDVEGMLHLPGHSGI